MKRTNLYIEVSSVSPRKSEKQYGYIIEAESNGHPVTVGDFGKAEGSYHLVTLTALIEATRDLIVLKRSADAPLLFYVDLDEAATLAEKADYLKLIAIYDALRDAADAIRANGNVGTVLTSLSVAVRGRT